jgi:hypothetical protein
MFHSRKFNSAELNYEIYDKEMLAIIETMDQYRHYFEGLGQPTTIFSDHRNLLWFTETKVYNHWQARWAEKLSRFHCKIVFRPSKQGGKLDALSRRRDYTLEKGGLERIMTFLKPDQVDTSLLPSDDPILAAIVLSPAMVALAEEANDPLSQFILDALSVDAAITKTLAHLCDPKLPRSVEMEEKL